MPQRVGRHRAPGISSKFSFTLNNDVFNRVNQAAASTRRSLSAEVEHRLRVALDMEPVEGVASQEREASQIGARMQLDAMAAMMASSFQLGVVTAAGQNRKPLSAAIVDWAIVTEGLAAAVRHIWADTGADPETIAKMRHALINSLPEF